MLNLMDWVESVDLAVLRTWIFSEISAHHCLRVEQQQVVVVQIPQREAKSTFP